MNRTKRKINFKVHRDYIKREAQHFKDHKKGLPEWIKNSDDSYTRHEDLKNKDIKNAKIILNLGKKQVACLDFGGTEFKKIEKHLFYWGDPKAATHGEELKKKIVSGGHGNGGKYYALAEFKKCKIINYYKGKLSVFTIEDDQDSVEIEDEKVEPYEAIKEAGLDKWEYFDKHGEESFKEINDGKLDFFCWVGIDPRDKTQLSDKRKIQLLLSSISNHLQSRSALRSRSVDALINGRLLWPNMTPEEADIDENFGIKEFAFPNEIEGYKFNKNFNSTLRVSLSKKPLTGEKSSFNILEVDAFEKNIAYYSIPDLMIDKGLSKSLVAHIDCPELKEYKCVSNDRVHLIDGEVTSLFLNWCRLRIKEVLEELMDKEKKKEEKNQLNDLRNFLDDITEEISELLEEDNIIKPAFSLKGKERGRVDVPTDKDGFGKDGEGGKKGDGKRKGGKENKEDNIENKKGKSKIRILLSNHDPDPLNPEQKYNMVERQDVLEQRVQDVDYGIWWLNTQKRYVRKLNIEKNPELTRIFILFLTKEAILAHKVGRAFKDQERYMPDDLHTENMNLIDNIFSKVVDRLGIEITPEDNTAEKIRKAISDKDKFTISQISEETGSDPMVVHAFIGNEGNHVKENYELEKEKVTGKGQGKSGIINVYVRK